MNQLEKVIQIAKTYHANQLDKGGNPYFNRLKKVALQVDSEAEKVLAYLHDIVEDTECTLERLQELGVEESIIEGLRAITKVEGEAYEDYLKRVKENELAIKVKLADLSPNMDMSRLSVIREKDLKRLSKYKKAVEFLK